MCATRHHGVLHLSLSLSEASWKHSRNMSRDVDGVIADPSAHKRMTGKYMLDVFGGFGFLTKA